MREKVEKVYFSFCGGNKLCVCGLELVNLLSWKTLWFQMLWRLGTYCRHNHSLFHRGESKCL